MITNQDRSGWFGASDISYIMGNFETATFKKWWLEKLDLNKNSFTNKVMRTGTNFEHKILDQFPEIEMDKQILIPELHLRVNYDGTYPDEIIEVKTYNYEKSFKVSKAYKEQVQVEMFAAKIYKAQIAAYGLTEGDYANYFAEIEPERLSHHPIEYDLEFIEKWLIRIKYLGECLTAGKMPRMEELNARKDNLPIL